MKVQYTTCDRCGLTWQDRPEVTRTYPSGYEFEIHSKLVDLCYGCTIDAITAAIDRQLIQLAKETP